MTSSIKSADDLIVQSENQKLGIVAPEPAKDQNPVKQEAAPEEKGEKQASQEEKSDDTQDASESQSEEGEGTQEDQAKNLSKDSKSETKDASKDDEVDDYGNKLDKPKLYTEAEVQQMIRDRLKRGNHPEQQQQVQEAVKDFKADPESSENWETQLEGFIEKTITKISTKQQQNDWKVKEEATQAEFEDKFTRGMGRYNDFKDVVSGKPISNAMMVATRSMPDPAAFLYAACKQHAGEIDKIAQMTDSSAQMVAIGRLEEKMKKVKSITKAPTPSKKITGDMSDDMPKKSVDQLIQEHAKTKIMGKR